MPFLRSAVAETGKRGEERRHRMNTSAKTAQLRLGLRVLIALLLLTLVELPVAFRVPRPLPYLLLINLADAWLIMWYFMHVSHLWRPEE